MKITIETTPRFPWVALQMSPKPEASYRLRTVTNPTEFAALKEQSSNGLVPYVRSDRNIASGYFPMVDNNNVVAAHRQID